MNQIFCISSSLPLLVGLQACIITLELNLEVPQRIVNRSSWKSSDTTDRNIPPNGPPCHRSTCSSRFVAALFVIARSWNQPRCPMTEEELALLFFHFKHYKEDTHVILITKNIIWVYVFLFLLLYFLLLIQLISSSLTPLSHPSPNPSLSSLIPVTYDQVETPGYWPTLKFLVSLRLDTPSPTKATK